ncbi:MAG: hypothetical protein IH614_02470 [Desulfuromonadales bacterium]|nr:hypothetical protein [Desulfuromonadales bacterium]
MRPCVRYLICIDGLCFDNVSDATKFVIHLASRRQPITITRQVDTTACLPS